MQNNKHKVHVYSFEINYVTNITVKTSLQKQEELNVLFFKVISILFLIRDIVDINLKQMSAYACELIFKQ